MRKVSSFIRKIRIFFLVVFIILSFACCHKNTQRTSGGEENAVAGKDKMATVTSPEKDTTYKWGEPVDIKIQFSDTTALIDSVRIAGLHDFKTYTGNYGDLKWDTKGSRVGLNNIRVNVYASDGNSESHSVSFMLESDVVPEDYSYTVVNKFPHDDKAYTQGLFYYDGRLYESTGLEGQSSLRIVDFTSGKIVKIVPLSSDIFAEGITNVNGKIYQVTWRNRVGFIYDINTLKKLSKFEYRVNEGWGLVFDGTSLIMSDGSSKLYFFEPEYFTQTDMLEIYDNKGPVDSINEMELIKGKIFANIYGSTYIVIIDPSTGRVTGHLDLDVLMPPGTKGDMGKVLNGIAYNPTTNHLYITGKNWPVLYEIAVSPL
jgi:glutaminyl-peptide cyclotransferase